MSLICSSVDCSQERISEHENMPIEMSHIEKQRIFLKLWGCGSEEWKMQDLWDK